MIQRIQSIWLLLAAITILCLLIVPTVNIIALNGEYNLYGTGLKSVKDANQSSNLLLMISTILAGLISIVNIFNFRNRTLQKRVISLNVLLILGLSFWLSGLVKTVTDIKEINIEAGMFLPIVAIIFSLLALRGIKKDENLIKSADRLR